MKLRTRTIRPGFRLFHGTSAEFNEQVEMQFPAWFSEKPRVARWFVNWHGEPQEYPYGKKLSPHARIAQFRVTRPLRVLSIPNSQAMDELREMAFADDPETLSEWVCSQGYDGWFIPNNYPDEGGSDIMICADDAIEHVESQPVQDSIYRVATRVLNEILDAGDDLPPRRSPHAGRFGWKPVEPGQGQQQHEQPKAVKIGHKPTPASRWQQIPPTWEQPMTYLSKEHLDAMMQRIKDEEALPPHKQNAARIAAMKQQALEMMKRLEALEVQRQADRLLPRIDG